MKTRNYPLTLLILLVGSLSLSACEPDEEEPFEETDPVAETQQPGAYGEADQNGMQQGYGQNAEGATELRAKSRPRVQTAVAILHPTEGNEVGGTVHFTSPAGQGVQVNARVSGLPGGVHAYHVHVYGDCSAIDAASAGPHFNFQGGGKDPLQKPDRILGNLGELEAGPDGKASAVAPIQYARLNGARSIVGRSVVVHAKGNDPGQPPDGAAGARVACGVIGIAEPGMANADAKADRMEEADVPDSGDTP